MVFTLGIVPLTIVEDINLSIPNEVSTIEDNRGSFNILIIIANYFLCYDWICITITTKDNEN